MELFIPHECDVCGYTGEPKLLFRGPHIQKMCPNCDKHVKFISKSHVPDYREIKSKIWVITQEIPFIEKIKQQTGFNAALIGLELNMAYWKLYTTIRIEYGLDFVESYFKKLTV